MVGDVILNVVIISLMKAFRVPSSAPSALEAFQSNRNRVDMMTSFMLEAPFSSDRTTTRMKSISTTDDSK